MNHPAPDRTDLVVLVPTRQRPHAVPELARAFADTATTNPRLHWCLDGDDDAAAYLRAIEAAGPVYPNQSFTAGPRRRLVGTLNHHATRLAHPRGSASLTGTHPPPHVPFALAYLGDDHRPVTRGWDATFLDVLAGLRTGLVYGDDGHQHAALPTAVALTTDIVAALGFFAPSVLVHMYCDNFWADLGRGADAITYRPDVHITHQHPSVHPAGHWDASYRDSNSADRFADDRAAYHRYVEDGGLAADIARVRALRADTAPTEESS